METEAHAPPAATALDEDDLVSPRNQITMEQSIQQSLESMNMSLNSLALRPDPDAQATVTDFSTSLTTCPPT